MNFSSELSKLLTNKYFMYFIVFLASTNVLGYLITRQLNAVLFFTLVSVLAFQFSKNMTIVLLVALIVTNLVMSNKMIREGMENDTTATDANSGSEALDKVASIDAKIATTLPLVKESVNNEEVKKKIESRVNSEAGQQKIATAKTAISNVDINNTDLNKAVEEENAPEGFVFSKGAKASNGSKASAEHFGPRIDYASTLEQSYQHLDNLLGSDSIKQLTGDTQKLMQQQQNLFNTMNQMVPVLEGAQNMLKGFDMKGLTNSLSSLGNLPNILEKK